MTTNLDIRPFLSIIVIVYNMRREAPRTLYSLSTLYQAGVTADDYEVVVVENGSTEPLPAGQVTRYGPNFKYYYFDTKSHSPSQAVNFGVSRASGLLVGLMVDGARILSPGVLHYAILASRAYVNPVVSTLGWHLGPDVQTRSTTRGYSPEVEDDLLKKSSWILNGYKLFEISSLAGSSVDGFFMPIAESNCFFIKKEKFIFLGGFDERFDAPGGGLVNLDFYKQACELPDAHRVIILGEGSFHQAHGGVSTNVSEERNCLLWKEFEKQYIEIRGIKYLKSVKPPEFIGHLPPASLGFIQYSADKTRAKQKPLRRFKSMFKQLLRRTLQGCLK